MAIETAGSFSSATVNGYTVRTSPTTSTLSAVSNSLVSENISAATDTIENKKIIMGIDVKVAFSNVNATFVIEVSHNGTDWVTAVTIDSDTEPDSTGVKTYLVDLTDIYSPYFRLHYNKGALSVGSSGTLQFFHAYT